MPFRLRRDTRRWFRDIEHEFDLDYDMYHLCLMAGLGERRKEEVDAEDTTVLIDHFPGEYEATGQLIVGSLLTVELEVLNIGRSDRSSLHSTINDLVDPEARSYLSQRGMKLMNQYSYGGYEVITEWYDERPHSFGGFFPTYYSNIRDILDGLSLTPIA